MLQSQFSQSLTLKTIFLPHWFAFFLYYTLIINNTQFERDAVSWVSHKGDTINKWKTIPRQAMCILPHKMQGFFDELF